MNKVKVRAAIPRSKKRKIEYNDDLAFAKLETDSKKQRTNATGTTYKHPPVKTPSSAKIEQKKMPLPKRNSKSGRYFFEDNPEFQPNLSPKQVLQAGAFGGTYFRRIKSSITGTVYTKQWKEFPRDWFDGLTKSHINRSWKDYNCTINYYKVKCGGDLDMWESSGWINPIDPYGWFQWYCRFFLGRRSDDDERQIKRWKGICSDKGRFRNQLIGKCARNGKTYNDKTISPVIRQTLLHWGYVLTEKDAEKYVALKKLPKLKKSTQKESIEDW